MERFLADIPVIDHPHGLLPRPFYRDHHPPLPPASAAPESSFEIENICRKAQPEPLLRIRCQQRERRGSQRALQLLAACLPAAPLPRPRG